MAWEKTQLGEPYTICVYLDKLRGQGRPRFSKYGVYELQSDKNQKRIIAAAWREKFGGIQFKDQASSISFSIGCTRRLPKSSAKWREGEPDTCKPDVDNIAKSVMDALCNGVATDLDDSAVDYLEIYKLPRLRRFDDKDVMQITITYYRDIYIRG